MATYRLIETGPARDREYLIQKKTIFGWRTLHTTTTEDRALAYFDYYTKGPKVVCEETV